MRTRGIRDARTVAPVPPPRSSPIWCCQMADHELETEHHLSRLTSIFLGFFFLDWPFAFNTWKVLFIC